MQARLGGLAMRVIQAWRGLLRGWRYAMDHQTEIDKYTKVIKAAGIKLE